MTHRLFWKLCLILATGVVALFYLIDIVTSQTQDGMSYLDISDKETITAWGRTAEELYLASDASALDIWLKKLQEKEDTWVTVVSYDIKRLAGNTLKNSFYEGYNLGRNVDWKIHLYFTENPVMEVPFMTKQVSFLVQLPARMRPGVYWHYTDVTMQVIIPTILLVFLSYLLYRYLMKPLRQLQIVAGQFSKGNFDVRAHVLMGNRNDEFSTLAETFDNMASRIGEQINSQRQLISDLSHELRTPLTRLDIALAEEKETGTSNGNIERINRESTHIRKLVEDTLTLAWLDNEKPELKQETLELIDLLDVLVDDAKFEFPDRIITCEFPNTALIEASSHRAAGQALENILRNALRYTPSGKTVTVKVKELAISYQISIEDQGSGVPEKYLETIFKPFFRVDRSRFTNSDSFGLGLALAQRQLSAIRATVVASNMISGGLRMLITFPKI
jgi:two-component system sensor histidine kinase PfeS